MTVLEAVLLVGFAARLTRLVIVDEIAEPVVVRLAASSRWLESLLSCPFCIGFWLSAAVLGSWVLAGGTVAWQLVAGVFTLNYVHGHLNGWLDLEDDNG